MRKFQSFDKMSSNLYFVVINIKKTFLLYVLCYMLYVICYILYVICYMLYVICYMLYVICDMLYVICYTNMYLDSLLSNGLLPLITLQTRISGRSATLLD